jgi:hypothetical protein
MSEEYRVQQGDCISSIAFKHGFFPDTLWNHPKNAQLKQLRKDRNILLEGDVVFIPDKQSNQVAKTTDARHRFCLKGVPEKLRLIIRNENDQARGNVQYTLTIDGAHFQGATGSDGSIEHWIAPSAASARLVLHDGAQETVFVLPLGHLDPITQVSGIQMRLRNLDFYNGEIDGELNEKTEWAIEEFQRRQGLEPTGRVDDRTRAKLEEVHCS